MDFKSKLANCAIESLSAGYKPNVSPACANYVSAMCRQAGKDININYVPNFFSIKDSKLFNKKVMPTKGVIVVFDYTYDAVAPSGIGEEDTMTHIGIVIDNKGSLVHFSNSQWKPVLSNIANWYINSYIDLEPGAIAENPIKEHWAYDSYKNLFKRKIVTTPEDNVNLSETISRGEVYKIVSRTIEYVLKEGGKNNE